MFKGIYSAPSSTADMRVLVSVEEAATMLSMGRTFVYDLIMRGEIRSIKVGRTRRVLVSSLYDYVGQLMNQAS